MRDEVLGEWADAEGRPELHIHLHVSGGLVFGTAGMRDRIFPPTCPWRCAPSSMATATSSPPRNACWMPC